MVTKVNADTVINRVQNENLRVVKCWAEEDSKYTYNYIELRGNPDEVDGTGEQLVEYALDDDEFEEVREELGV